MNEKMNFWQYLLHDSKSVSVVAILLLVGTSINLYTAHDNGYYESNTAFYLWLFFGLFVPALIVFKVVQGYRDYLKGKSR